jgi:hypothetical protein
VVEWLKVKGLSSNLSTAKKKKTVSDMETPGPKVAQEVKYFAPQIDGKEEPRPKRAGCVTRVIQQAQIQFQ